jgi:hypothetical protein
MQTNIVDSPNTITTQLRIYKCYCASSRAKNLGFKMFWRDVADKLRETSC